jgi:hypothetical protein
MRKMNKEEKKIIENEIRMIIQSAVSSEYARYILEHENEETENTFMDDVIEDVMCASAWDEEGYYNDDDIRLSIGRVLIDRLGIDY